MRVDEFHQRDLFRAAPALQLFLAINGRLHFIERFPVEQPPNSIFVGETFNAVKFVLEDATVEIARHSYVERS